MQIYHIVLSHIISQHIYYYYYYIRLVVVVWSHEKNGTQQNCTTLVEMEAPHHPTQRQTEEALDGEHQGGRRIQRINTERDRTISFVPGQKRVEKLRH